MRILTFQRREKVEGGNPGRISELINDIVEKVPDDIVEKMGGKKKVREKVFREIWNLLIEISGESLDYKEINEKFSKRFDDIGKKFGISKEDIENIKKKRRVGKWDNKTIKNLISGVRSSKEMTIKKIEEAVKYIDQPKKPKWYMKEIGRIGEELTLFGITWELARSRHDYIVLPYFKKANRGKRGRKGEGVYHVDIAVIDFTTKVIGLIEVKNWPSREENIYLINDYKSNDKIKWKRSEDDIRKFLEILTGKRKKGRSTPVALKLFDDIRRRLLVEIGKNKKSGEEKEGELIELRFNLSMDRNIETLLSDTVNAILGSDVNIIECLELMNNVEYLLISPGILKECTKNVFLDIKLEEFKVMKFFVTYTGIPKEDDKNGIKGGRRLDKEILEEFKRDGINYIEINPALLGILRGKYWQIARIVSWLILMMMDETVGQYNEN